MTFFEDIARVTAEYRKAEGLPLLMVQHDCIVEGMIRIEHDKHCPWCGWTHGGADVIPIRKDKR